jgi:hypothetical protein
MKKISLREVTNKLLMVTVRFHLVLVFIFGVGLYLFLKINYPKHALENSTLVFFILCALAYIPISLMIEDTKNRIFSALLFVLPIPILSIYSFSLPEDLFVFQFYQVFIFVLFFVLTTFVVSFVSKDNDIAFWEFSKKCIWQFIISNVFAQVLFVGLSLAILSLKELFKIDVQIEVYKNLAVICYVFFAPIFFLANLPNKIDKFKKEYTFDKLLKVLGLYILMPILALYSLILYVYLFQIIIKWELPNGWVSLLVSVLALGGFLSMLITYPLRLNDENKFVNFLFRYFPLLLMPLLVLMSVGIFRRLGDYGLTINRCYVLILNLWLFGISVYLFLSKANHLKWIIISFSVVMFVSSVGPWSVFSITKQSLIKEIGQLLNKAKLIENGKVIDNYKAHIKVDSILSKKIYEDVKYICNTYGTNSIQLFFKDSIGNLNYLSINNRLGISESNYYAPYLLPDKKSSSSCKYFTAKLSSKNQLIDIGTDFKSYIELSRQNDTEQVYEGDDLIVKYLNNSFLIYKPTDKNFKISIPLQAKLKEITKQKDKGYDFSPKDLTIDGMNFKLIISNLTGFYYQKSDSITVTNIEANLFLK